MDLLSYLRQNEETRMVEQERLKQALQFRIQVSLRGLTTGLV